MQENSNKNPEHGDLSVAFNEMYKIGILVQIYNYMNERMESIKEGN